ncbi:hypothetical protein B0I35DRAFT_366013 [Stachybotrys elegans]|uniref:Rhodopsin domain-containing protein n=1 Tax=Stachybotrys elegans TaxID=80388 RepID=A0A8K0SBY3_9HYPO|nr:hypothetical protein B0I35DRAFT_366013 [Stachybotrys elegans]
MSFATDEALRLFIIQICCISIVYMAVGLRCFVRCSLTKVPKLDDVFMYMSVLLYTAQSSFVLRGIILGGLGQHGPDLTTDETVVGFKSWYFGELISALVTITVRLSVAILLLRMCKNVRYHERYEKIVYGCLAIFWRPDMPGACSSTIVPNTAITLSAVAAVSDVMLALLPIVLIWGAKIHWKKKVFIGVLMGLGVGAGAMMIARIFYIRGVDITAEFLYTTV